VTDSTKPIDLGRPAVSTISQAADLFTHLSDVMDSLLRLIEEETALVREGRVSEIARLEPLKTDLARLYIADINRLKVATPFLKSRQPDLLRDLRARHDSFQALLQINLTVLATARAVAESIIRGVSQEMNRKAAPQGYGASGQQNTTHQRRTQPLVVSRSL
jgi:hypothetical protein